MRVTTLFNRLLVIPGASVTAVEFNGADVVVELRLRARRLRCPCGLDSAATYDRSRRRWRHLDHGAHKLWLVTEIRRLDCPGCGVRTEMVPWARPNARHTRDFEDQVAWLAQRTDRTSVATLMRCSWEAVTAIIGRVVADHLTAARFDELTRLGVDEICYRHPNRYLTVVGDHDKGRVVWVARGRESASLSSFYDTIGPARRKRIKAVSMDMSVAFTGATYAALPKAAICFDPFHVMMWANRALDAAASASVSDRNLPTVSARDWRATRWALRRGSERLPDDKRALINTLRRSRHRLFRAWELKEMLRDLYRNINPTDARDYLKHWCTTAKRSKIPAFIQLAKKITNHFEGIIAAIRLGITNALAESINAKIRLINARGYGHHSPEALTSMIYLCLGGIPIALPTQR